jgi:hypothetical protein
MNTVLFCEECDIEYRIKHDSDDDAFLPTFCPFCGVCRTNIEDQYNYEGEDEED